MATTNKKVSDYLHDDIVFSILSKLPIKSLKRFTCVQKSGTLLFENSYFMRMFCKNYVSKKNSLDNDTHLLLLKKVQLSHYHRYSELYLLFGERFENKVRLDWPPPFQTNDDVRILGSDINGTLCLHNRNKIVALWNPTNKEFKVTSSSPPGFPPIYGIRVNLYGFGYDYLREDYKVIRHVDYFPFDGEVLRKKRMWQIYSLRSDCWRILDIDMPVCDDICIEGREVYLNGMCHWWGKINFETYLVSFNFTTELFFTTLLPLSVHENFDSKWVQGHFLILNGSIAMLSIDVKTDYFHISILGELGVKESWTKLSTIRVSPGVLPPLRPIGVGKKRDASLKTIDNELFCVDLNIQTLEEIGVKGDLSGCQILRYKKNLLKWKNQ